MHPLMSIEIARREQHDRLTAVEHARRRAPRRVSRQHASSHPPEPSPSRPAQRTRIATAS